MNYFSVNLFDSRGTNHFDRVTQFIGADDHGSFGMLAGHIHTVILLRYGLARFTDHQGTWHYLALPGGVLRFCNNQLSITTVRYFLGDDRERICQRLTEEMEHTDSEIRTAKATLSEIERSLLRRLTQLSQPF